jgi:metallo-beta-lactamase class B
MRRFLISILTPLAVLAGDPPEWSRPYPPHRIAGHIYYVGTEDLACFLVTGPAGHILVNTALADANSQLLGNIEKLGFRPKDIKILLTNQAHYDHVAGMAEIQRITGAEALATPPDAKLLEAGGKNDPAGITGFAPVTVKRTLRDGETIQLGPVALKTVYAFGHTQGSASYETTVVENGKTLSFLFANMGTVVMPLSNPKYPEIVADFRRTFARQRLQHPEIWVAGHGSQYGMKAKHAAGSFVDPAGFQAAVAQFEMRFERQVKIELGQPSN